MKLISKLLTITLTIILLLSGIYILYQDGFFGKYIEPNANIERIINNVTHKEKTYNEKYPFVKPDLKSKGFSENDFYEHLAEPLDKPALKETITKNSMKMPGSDDCDYVIKKDDQNRISSYSVIITKNNKPINLANRKAEQFAPISDDAYNYVIAPYIENLDNYVTKNKLDCYLNLTYEYKDDKATYPSYIRLKIASLQVETLNIDISIKNETKPAENAKIDPLKDNNKKEQKT